MEQSSFDKAVSLSRLVMTLLASMAPDNPLASSVVRWGNVLLDIFSAIADADEEVAAKLEEIRSEIQDIHDRGMVNYDVAIERRKVDSVSAKIQALAEAAKARQEVDEDDEDEEADEDE